MRRKAPSACFLLLQEGDAARRALGDRDAAHAPRFGTDFLRHDFGHVLYAPFSPAPRASVYLGILGTLSKQENEAGGASRRHSAVSQEGEGHAAGIARGPRAAEGGGAGDKLACLTALEQKVLWLSTWMIHNANHLRPSRDGLKVGGHQASSASVATLMTALYLDVMRPQDRVAVKPHAAPVFHALQYLLGQQTREKLERFRAFGGAQAYPSRSKDGDIVDFSTGLGRASASA